MDDSKVILALIVVLMIGALIAVTAHVLGDGSILGTGGLGNRTMGPPEAGAKASPERSAA